MSSTTLSVRRTLRWPLLTMILLALALVAMLALERTAAPASPTFSPQRIASSTSASSNGNAASAAKPAKQSTCDPKPHKGKDDKGHKNCDISG